MGSLPRATELPVNFQSLLDWLRDCARRVRKEGLPASWYLFGSSLRDFQGSKDIDVLLIYPRHVCPVALRAAAERACGMLPVHLLLASCEEEEELGLKKTQGGREIHLG
jgi:hypothetical protein